MIILTIRWAERVEQLEGKQILLGKLKAKRPRGGRRHRWEDNIQI